MGHNYRYDLYGFFAQGLPRLHLGCQQELGLMEFGVLFLTHVVISKIYFLTVVENMVVCFFKAGKKKKNK